MHRHIFDANQGNTAPFIFISHTSKTEIKYVSDTYLIFLLEKILADHI